MRNGDYIIWWGSPYMMAMLAQFYSHPFKLAHMDLLDAALLCCLWVGMRNRLL